ncbi:MAG: hypothetical protein RR963_06795 [Anaerovoracaceae bacterium]
MSDISITACGNNEYLVDYFQSIVNIVDNPIGKYNRVCILNRLKLAVPGEAAMVAWMNYGKFKDIFYSDTPDVPEKEQLDSLLNAQESWWADSSVPFVCNTIYSVTENTRNSINTIKATADQKSITALMKNNHTAFYRYLLKNHKNKTQEAYSKLTDVQKKTGKEDYIKAITSTPWIANKTAAARLGAWADPDWELYHHWNKLMILGATLEEVTSVINTLIQKGLPVPENVNQANWTLYSRWVSMSEELTWEDFKEAQYSMQRGIAVGLSWCDEVFSGLFISEGGPGSPYWQRQPEVSCFSENTFVLMANGNLCKISKVKPGDEIATPNGKKTVMLVSTPIRGSRKLYSFNRHKFKFSSTHPFHCDFGYGCIEPEVLASFIPTFKEEKVEKLKPGVRLKTARRKMTEVLTIQSYDNEEKSKDELLYDLIPQVDESGVFEYYVGDEDIQYLVSSEVPIITKREQETLSFMKMFDIITLPILKATAHIKTGQYWSSIQGTFSSYVKDVLGEKIGRLEISAFEDTPSSKTLSSLFSDYQDMFEDTDMNIRIGLLFSSMFSTLLPFFLQRKISAKDGKEIGRMIKEDIDSKILVF